jgi:hypothetical protein
MFMDKFTKYMAAIAVSALVAGPVSAETYSTTKASSALSGKGCKADKTKDLQLTIDFNSLGVAGPSTGVWQSTFFDFGTVVNADGTFIVSTPGKTIDDAPKQATMDLSNDMYNNMQTALANFAATCKNAAGYNGDAQIIKFDAKWSKNGDKVSVKMQGQGTYNDTKGKSNTVDVNVDAKNMELVVVPVPTPN